MTGEEAIRYMVGDLEPEEPAGDDIAAWRAFLLARQSVALEAAPDTKPAEVFPAVLLQVRALFLAKFPDGEADRYFTPADPPAEPAQVPATF